MMPASIRRILILFLAVTVLGIGVRLSSPDMAAWHEPGLARADPGQPEVILRESAGQAVALTRKPQLSDVKSLDDAPVLPGAAPTISQIKRRTARHGLVREGNRIRPRHRHRARAPPAIT